MFHYLVLALLVIVVYIYIRRFNITYEKNKHTKYATIKAFQSITHFPKNLRVFCLQSQMFYHLGNTIETRCFIYYHGKTNHCMYRKPMIKLLYNYGSVIVCEYKHGKVDPVKLYDLAVRLGHKQIIAVGESDACDYAISVSDLCDLILVNPSKKHVIPANSLVLHRPDFHTDDKSTYWPVHGNDNVLIMPDKYIYRLSEYLEKLDKK